MNTSTPKLQCECHWLDIKPQKQTELSWTYLQTTARLSCSLKGSGFFYMCLHVSVQCVLTYMSDKEPIQTCCCSVISGASWTIWWFTLGRTQADSVLRAAALKTNVLCVRHSEREVQWITVSFNRCFTPIVCLGSRVLPSPTSILRHYS